jgi:two-component system phosphate regulon response regulator PhoB
MSGLNVIEAADGHEALNLLESREPDLAMVDWMLPGLPGVDLVQRIRQTRKHAQLPIIMLTARSDDEDRIRGLDSGADDYVTKPYKAGELIARIRALLRRAATSDEEDGIYQIGPFCIDMPAHKCTVDGSELQTGPLEFRLLKFLITHPDRVYSRTELLDYVWGTKGFVEERTIDVHIRRLRKLLDTRAECIQTVRGAGYRFSIQQIHA